MIPMDGWLGKVGGMCVCVFWPVSPHHACIYSVAFLAQREELSVEISF